MSNYTLSDVLEELDLLSPEDVVLDNSVGRSTAESFLGNVKSSIARMLSSDTDAVYGIMYITRNTILALANSMQADLNIVFENLPAATANESTIDYGTVEAANVILEDLKSGTLVSRRRKLAALQSRVKTLASSITRLGSVANNKDPNEAQAAVSEALRRLSASYEELASLHDNFLGALTTYYNQSLALDGVDAQVDKVIDRMSNFEGARGSARSILTLSTALGMLDERMTVRSPAATKYEGTLTVLDGTPAYITGTKSWPQSLQAAATVEMRIDGDAAVSPGVTMPVSTAAVLRAAPKLYYVSAGPTPPAGEPVELFPYTNARDAQFRIVVDNTLYTVIVDTSTAALADINDLAAGLDAALTAASAPVTVTVSSDFLLFTSDTKGSRARISFANSGDPGLGVDDLNVDFGLTFDFYGEVLGVDTTVGDADLSAFTGSVPVLTSSNTRLLSLSTPTWRWNIPGSVNGVNSTGIGTTIEAGDIAVASNGSVYLVDTILGDDDILFSSEKVAAWDGSTLETITAPLANTDLDFYRNRVTITSPSKVWGTTSIELINYSASNVLGLPSTAPTLSGIHTNVTLDGHTSMGAPIRVGDVLVTNTDAEKDVAEVVNWNNSNMTVAPIAVDNLSGAEFNLTADDVKIYSRATWSYRNAFPSISGLTRASRELTPLEQLINRVGVVMASGGAAGAANIVALEYYNFAGDVITAYQMFEATTPNSLIELLQKLGENQLKPVADLLRKSDFDGLYTLQPDDLSVLGKVTSLIGAVSKSLTSDSETMQLISDTGIWDESYTEEYEELPLITTGPGVSPIPTELDDV